MNQVIREGVKTKVLMLSATPVNNRFNDLRNQLLLHTRVNRKPSSRSLRHVEDIEEIFRRAQAVFKQWSKLPPEERTAEAILSSLDFDFFELLDRVTIARSRRHIETFYDTTEIGSFPERRKPISVHCQLTDRPDVIGFNEIFAQLSMLTARRLHSGELHPAKPAGEVRGRSTTLKLHRGSGKLRQADREKSLQGLMTINLLKRLESSVEAFRITLAEASQTTTPARLLRSSSSAKTASTLASLTWRPTFENTDAGRR